MITRRTPARAAPTAAAWTRYFGMTVFGISQVLPLLMGAYLVSTAGIGSSDRPFASERLLAGLAFLCSAGMMLHLIRRRWLDGGQVGRSRALLAGVALLLIGSFVLLP